MTNQEQILLSLGTEQRPQFKRVTSQRERENTRTLRSSRGAVGKLSKSEELESNIVYDPMP